MTADEPLAVEWAAPALRALERLPEMVATAAIEFVYGPLADNPARVGHPLRFDLEGDYSARRGDHRLLYRIEVEERRVIILTIEHRSDVYRPSMTVVAKGPRMRPGRGRTRNGGERRTVPDSESPGQSSFLSERGWPEMPCNRTPPSSHVDRRAHPSGRGEEPAL